MLDLRVGDRLYRSPMVEVEEEQSDNVGVFQIRDANDPEVVNRQGISSTSNFAPIKLASFSDTQKVDFNGVKKYQKNVDLDYLRSLQFDEPGKYGSVDKKVNWLVNKEGEGARPYFIVNGQSRFGTILFARTLVKVETVGGAPKEYIKRGTFPSGITEDIVLYHVVGMPKILMQSGLSGKEMHEKYPYWIVPATAFGNDQEMTMTPRGATHFHCVWNDQDYPSNYADGKLYIAKAFLI